MLMNNNRLAFLTSSDEIMFLRMEVKEIKHRATKHGQAEESKALFHEPWLEYTKPMKISTALGEGTESITTRMGLFYLFTLATDNNEDVWLLPDEMGKCLNYAKFTEDGEDLKLPLPILPRPRRSLIE